jgi:hypothetical protein
MVNQKKKGGWSGVRVGVGGIMNVFSKRGKISKCKLYIIFFLQKCNFDVEWAKCATM